jgi:hypothetical protein
MGVATTTEFQAATGKHYLCSPEDAYSSRIVGYSIDESGRALG